MLDISHLTPNGPRAPTAQGLADEAARALPDALFENDPEVKRLKERHELLRDVRQSFKERRTWLTAQRRQLESRAQEVQSSMKWAALADCNASDGEFTRSRAAVTEVAMLNSLLDATSGTMKMLEQRPATGNEIDRETDDARIALERRVFALKLAHVAKQSSVAAQSTQT